MDNAIPEKMLAWPLFGTGMETFGVNDQPCVVPVPRNGPDQLLVKIEAIGLCFSDVKLIRAGESHPRVISKDLSKDPVIPGHEAVMRVVRVGDQLKDKFKVGDRFIIQADIYVNGKGFAYGYAIDGGMEQYSLIDQRVLNGDEGCYLLPISEHMPAAIAALLEPWTCVQASYMIENRREPLAGGRVLVVGCGCPEKVYTAGALLKKAGVASVSVFNLGDAVVAALEQELNLKVEKLAALPEDKRYDDIFICDVTDREIGQKAAKMGTHGAVVSFVGNYKDQLWSFDVGSIHYEGWFYQGTTGNELAAAYNKNVRSRWKPHGSAFLPGGAGAMGQMHTQMAVETPDGPDRILITDMDDTRIANVKRLLADAIKKRNIEFEALNPSKMSAAEFDAAVRRFAPEGFDDVVMLVPVVPVLNSVVPYLGKNGMMNIFAGIPAGKEGTLNVGDIVEKNVRYIGSSGSKTAHLRHTLALAEEGKLKPVTALAGLGGMKDLKKGLEAVAGAKFPGKTVIFPNCPDMPLGPVSEIEKLAPGIRETLSKDGFYTEATEQVLLAKYQQK